MNLDEAKPRAASLRDAIRHHNRLYYVEAAPTISDREYDQMYAELVALEQQFPQLVTADSPTRRVGGEPSQGFVTRPHAQPMFSLDNTYDEEDLRKFHEYVCKGLQTQDVGYTVEPKVDGVSISVRYENGILTHALTRGNGTEGDDVTANVRTIGSIPLRLSGDPVPEVLEARGEVYMAKTRFRELNETRQRAGETPFANARNATAGSLKLLDPRTVAQRPLECLFYAHGETRGIPVACQTELLELFRRCGLRTQAFCPLVHTLEEICQAVKHLGRERHTYPYDIDGAVIKVNAFSQRDLLGFTAKAPSWAKAYKYAAEQIMTRLHNITIQVGRTGILTPVAELEPVFLAGSTISRATLHNEDEIRRKDVRVGDTVVIEKAGDVIPAVVEVVRDRRPPDAEPFDFTAHIENRCPSCGGAIQRDPQFVAWRCENLQCPAQGVRRIRHFAARAAMDIDALGGVVAEKLVERGLAREPLDLFVLDEAQVANLNLGTDEEPRSFGSKNAAKMMTALERAKDLPLDRWIHALGIPNVGAATAFHLAACHLDLEAVANSCLLSDLVAFCDPPEATPAEAATDLPAPEAAENERIKRLLEAQLIKASAAAKNGYVTTNVGAKTAQSVLDFFASESGIHVLRRLRDLGIRPHTVKRSGTGPDGDRKRLEGQTFVITGTLETMSRDEAAERVRSLGATAAGSVTRNTNYLVAGANTGARKTQKAAELGVEILDEGAFLALLEGRAETNRPGPRMTAPYQPELGL